MILRALVNYYYRKASDPESGIAAPGFEIKEIPFIILLDPSGNFLQIEDTRELQGKKLIGRKFTIPKSIIRTGAKFEANFLWDTVEYVFGINEDIQNTELDSSSHILTDSSEESEELKEKGKLKAKCEAKRKAFALKLKTFFPELRESESLKVVIKFLESDFMSVLKNDCLWDEIVKSKANVSFRIAGVSHIVCENEEIVKSISNRFLENDHIEGEENEKVDQINGICLLSGKSETIARLHNPIKGVHGTQSGGAKIVSFNFDAGESYNKRQSYNAPVGKVSNFAYSTALNYLIKSKQKISLGETTTIVFWGDENNTFEENLADIFDSPPKDDPDRMTKAVSSLYQSPKTGGFSITEDNIRFHVLGLSPNVTRLSIRFCWSGTIAELAIRIKQHFEDLKIIGGFKEYYSLYQLIQGVTLNGDVSKNASPLIVGNFLESIFDGTTYPHTLLTLALRRLRDEEGVSHRRVALIKAWLNRYTRKIQKNEKEVLVGLDETNNNIGYVLGRLFSVLEKAQGEALGKETIRDRFYGGASTTPIMVFPNLLKLKNHHLAKLENRGRAYNFETLIGEILGLVIELPSNLTLVDQGRFAVGYYHQRQEFYTKK